MDAQLNLDFSLLLPCAKNSQLIKFDTCLFEMESQLQITQLNGSCVSVSNDNRRETISFILQLSHKFDPLLSYIAIDYLQRFISTQPILTQVLVYVYFPLFIQDFIGFI